MHSSTILSILGLAASASAHMKLNEPKSWFTNNSPLDATGKDFPCKNVDYNGPSEMNTYAQGQSAPLTFIGQAVHGGGSCQISLTTDKNPTKDSVWRVIKSYVGGCPAVDEAGNMGDNAEALDPYVYDFKIPEGIPAGEYTLAWTWFNRIGNREMYMQCAPATITGDSGDEAFFNSLPEMFKANIPGIGADECRTTEGVDVEFPNPGQFVQRLGSFKAEAPVGNCGGSGSSSPPAAPPSNDNGNGNGNGNNGEAPAPSATPTPPSNGNGNGSGSRPGKDLPGGVFVEPTQPTAEPAPAAPVEEGPADEAPADETPAPSNPPASGNQGGDSGASPSGGFPAGTSCPAEGSWNCIGGSSFQRCASGQWSATIALASGTSCTPGVSQDIAISRRGLPVKAPRFGAKMRM